jgi:hypothetical protein
VRTLDGEIEAVLDDATLLPTYFVEILFDDFDLRVHTDLGEISTLGETWTGVGKLGSIGAIEERDDSSPSGTTLTLNGLNAEILNEALDIDYYGRPVTIYLGMRDILTGVLVADPFEVFSGQVDQMHVAYGTDTATVSISVESEWIMFERSPMRWFSDNQLQRDHSGDLGFQYLAAMANLKITLGNGTPTYLGSNPGTINPDSIRRNER